MKLFSLIILAVFLTNILSCAPPSTHEGKVSTEGFPADIPIPPKVLEVVEAEEYSDLFLAVYECDEEPQKVFQMMQDAFEVEGWKLISSYPLEETSEASLNFEKPDGRRAVCQISPSGEGHSSVRHTIVKK